MARNSNPCDHVCIDCGVHFIGYGQRRCADCQRRHNAKNMAASRARKRDAEMENNDSAGEGWQFCTKCKKKRHLSEFRTRYTNGRGKRNKICDRCLTRIYAKREYKNMNERYWRTKAYNCNTVGRQRVARIRGVKLPETSLNDLEWICKPQDLVKLFNKQNGKCYYCGVDLSTENLDLDHKTPLSRDGHHNLSNVCFSCRDCNVLKGTRTEKEFADFIKEYSARFAKTSREQDKEPADNTNDAIHSV